MKPSKMRRWIALTLFALSAALSGCGGSRPQGDGRPDATLPTQAIPPADLTRFRDALDPYGEWAETEAYGSVWVPYATPAGWRPYTTGRWLPTDQGWMWLEEEPWGWAAFHYGRWTLDERLGWAWIPGNTWAPAWVAWRYGQGYVGWAPLSPDVDWLRESKREDSDALARDVDRFAWSFVRSRGFTRSPVTPQVAPAGRNPTLLGLTRGAGRYVPSGARAAERGFAASGAVGAPPKRYRLVEAARHRQNRAAIVHGSTVEIYRPEALKAQTSPGPSSVSQRPSGSRIQDLMAREKREQERFSERMTKERERLRREQEMERRQRPQSLSEDRLRKRQNVESEAQEAFERRERALFEQRRGRLRDRLGLESSR